MRKQTAIKSLVRVHFTKRNTGMGVVVEDASGIRRIITAAHCVPYPNAAGIGNVDAFVGISAFGSSATRPLMACVVSWESCADIAVLGLETNSGTMSPDYERLEQLLESLTPAAVCLDVAPLSQEFKVHVCQHTGKWSTGVAKNYMPLHLVPYMLHAEFPKSQAILAGTSGSPMFGDDGRVIAVVSTSTEISGSSEGSAIFSCLAGALPAWMLDNLTRNG